MNEAKIKALPLADAKTGDLFTIGRMDIDGLLRRRLLDLGFVPGATVKVMQRSPLGDPVAYQVSSTTIALRKQETTRIFGEVSES